MSIKMLVTALFLGGIVSAIVSCGRQGNNDETEMPHSDNQPLSVERASASDPWKGSYEAGELRGVNLGSGVVMDLVWIPPGQFMMGSSEMYDYEEDEIPHRRVRITRGFWIGRYPVTQGQWEAVMGNNPSEFRGYSRPVENVTWDLAQDFCVRLKELGLGEFRLPTEAEWEYACRAGSTRAYYFGDDPDDLADYAWFDENSGLQTHPVGLKPPNAWGLYDMHGNVWEWCLDWHEWDYYSRAPVDDPLNEDISSIRTMRGGGWVASRGMCRSAYRGAYDPEDWDSAIGFRVVKPSIF